MKNKFAARLSMLRKRSGMSQKSAAERLGISQALLSHYEKGKRECGLDFVITASSVFGVSADYLLGLSDRLPTDSADTGIYEELSKKPKLYQSRNNLQNALDMLYSIAARSGSARMQNDLNNLLYADVYSVLHLFYNDESGRESPAKLFTLPNNQAYFHAAAQSATAYDRLNTDTLETQGAKCLDYNSLRQDFTANAAAVTGIIESVENRAK